MGQLSLVPSGVAKSSTRFGWGKGRNVTSAGWQVTLCDPIWHVSSRISDGRLACKLLYFFTLLFFTFYCAANKQRRRVRGAGAQEKATGRSRKTKASEAG